MRNSVFQKLTGVLFVVARSIRPGARATRGSPRSVLSACAASPTSFHPRTATRVLASPRPAFRAAPPAPAPRAHRNHELFLGQRAISLNLALIYAISCGRQSNWIDAGRAAAEKASQEPRRRQGGSLAGKAAEGYCHGELLLAARARSRDTRARCASRADPSRFAARRILPRSVREMHSQLQRRQEQV